MQGHELTELNGLAQSDRWFDSLSLGFSALEHRDRSFLDIDKFVETPEHFLHDVLSGLDGHSKAALALVYMRNNSVANPIELEESEPKAIERLGSSVGDCIVAQEAPAWQS